MFFDYILYYIISDYIIVLQYNPRWCITWVNWLEARPLSQYLVLLQPRSRALLYFGDHDSDDHLYHSGYIIILMIRPPLIIWQCMFRYNMEADGERIPESLHGACPTALGIKWFRFVDHVLNIDDHYNHHVFTSSHWSLGGFQTNGSVRVPRSGTGLVQ